MQAPATTLPAEVIARKCLILVFATSEAMRTPIGLACIRNPDLGGMRVYAPVGWALSMTSKRRKKHKSEQIVTKPRDEDAMLNAGKDLTAVLQPLEISEATLIR